MSKLEMGKEYPGSFPTTHTAVVRKIKPYTKVFSVDGRNSWISFMGAKQNLTGHRINLYLNPEDSARYGMPMYTQTDEPCLMFPSVWLKYVREVDSDSMSEDD